jgi:hypothetical protein
MLARFGIFVLLTGALSARAPADSIAIQPDPTILTKRRAPLPVRAEFPGVPYALVGDLGRGFWKTGRRFPRSAQLDGDRAPQGKLPTSTNGQLDFGLYLSTQRGPLDEFTNLVLKTLFGRKLRHPHRQAAP